MTSISSAERLAWHDRRLRVGSDSVRTARYRLLQSWYRETVLNAGYGTYTSRGSAFPCGSLLHADDVKARPGLNFLSAAAATYATQRAIEVQEANGSIEPGRLHHNMLSSMPLCFSIFGEARATKDCGLEFVRALLDSQATTVVAMECEWKPSTDLLGDRTAFDAMVITEHADGRRHLIGVETKYTEPFSRKAYASRVYDAVHTESEWFRPESPVSDLSMSSTNQLWRNMLLAAACELSAASGISSAAVCVLALADDPGAAKALAGVSKHLVDVDRRCQFVSFESMIATTTQIPELGPWSNAFKKRYLDLTPVERR